MWRSEAAGVEEALRDLASGEALEQMLQVCEQDMAVTDEALSDLRGTGLLSGKRKRGEEMASQVVRHSLWEQDSLEAYNELLFGHLDPEVEALQQRKSRLFERTRCPKRVLGQLWPTSQKCVCVRPGCFPDIVSNKVHFWHFNFTNKESYQYLSPYVLTES